METIMQKATEKIRRWKKEVQKKKTGSTKNVKKDWNLLLIALRIEQEEDKRLYNEHWARVKRLNRQKKESTEWTVEVVETENYYKRKEIRNFYKEAKNGRGKVNDTFYIKYKHGNLLGEDEKIKERWRAYFSEMLNEKTEE